MLGLSDDPLLQILQSLAVLLFVSVGALALGRARNVWMKWARWGAVAVFSIAFSVCRDDDRPLGIGGRRPLIEHDEITRRRAGKSGNIASTGARRPSMFFKFTSVVLAALLGVMLGSLPVTGSAQTVKIGVILPYSGSFAQAGDEVDKGLRLYMKEHEKELPPGVKIELVVRDSTGPNPEVAKRLAQELITRDHVQLLTGLVASPNAAAIAPLTAEAKLPLVIMNAAGVEIPRMSPYIVRVSFTLWQMSLPMGQWAAKNGYKTGFIAVSDFIPGHDAEAAFIKGFTDAGGHIIGDTRIPLSQLDFAPVLQRIKDAKPQTVFIFVPAQKYATAMIKAWADIGLKEAGIQLVTTQDVMVDEELPNMGNTPLGVVSTGSYSVAATRPQNKRFSRPGTAPTATRRSRTFWRSAAGTAWRRSSTCSRRQRASLLQTRE